MSVNKKNQALVSKSSTSVKKSWWNKKKIIAVSIISAALLAAIIAAVVILATTVFPIESSEEEARVVGYVGEYEVKYEELRSLTLLNKGNLDVELGKYDELNALEQIEYKKLLEERVMEDIKSHYVILTLCEEYGIRTDSIVLQLKVQNDIQEFVNSTFGGNVSKYKEWLKEEGLTDSFLRYTFRVDRLEKELQEHFVKNKIDIKYDETDLNAFIDYVMTGEDFVRTIHVFYPNKHPYTSEEARKAYVAQFQQGELDDDEFADYKQSWLKKLKEDADSYNAVSALERAEEASKKLLEIKNDDERYSEMKKAIGKSPVYVEGITIPSHVAGIYMTYGQMDKAYEDAAFEIEEYGVSGAVKTEDGYFVIMRLPLQEDDVKKQALELLTKYQYVPLKLRKDEVRAEIEFEGNEYFDSISLIDIE